MNYVNKYCEQYKQISFIHDIVTEIDEGYFTPEEPHKYEKLSKIPNAFYVYKTRAMENSKRMDTAETMANSHINYFQDMEENKGSKTKVLNRLLNKRRGEESPFKLLNKGSNLNTIYIQDPNILEMRDSCIPSTPKVGNEKYKRRSPKLVPVIALTPVRGRKSPPRRYNSRRNGANLRSKLLEMGVNISGEKISVSNNELPCLYKSKKQTENRWGSASKRKENSGIYHNLRHEMAMDKVETLERSEHNMRTPKGAYTNTTYTNTNRNSLNTIYASRTAHATPPPHSLSPAPLHERSLKGRKHLQNIEEILEECKRLGDGEGGDKDKLSFRLALQRYKHDKWLQTFHIMKEIDVANAPALELMYTYEKTKQKDIQNEMIAVTKEYRGAAGLKYIRIDQDK